jgi:tetratricopeptide (TPR) repeat protein
MIHSIKGEAISQLYIFVAKIPPMNRTSLLTLFICLLISLTACNEGPPPASAKVGITSGDPAIDQLTKAIQTDPTNADLYAQRATMWYDKENYDGAIEDMVAALSIDSTNINYHYNLADVYLEYYRSRLALRTLERAARLAPDNVETQLRLAETQLILQQYDGALQSLNEVIRLDARNPDAYLLLSETFLETGDTARAIKAAEEATEIDPDMTDAFISLGQLLFAKKLPRAGQYFDAAIAIDPEDPIALHAKGDFLRDSERLPEAIELYRKASIADRNYVAGYFNAGLLFMELDSFNRARKEFDLVIKNDPVHIRGFFFRGYASELLGNKAAAQEDYEVALRFAPDYEFALEGMERLKE